MKPQVLNSTLCVFLCASVGCAPKFDVRRAELIDRDMNDLPTCELRARGAEWLEAEDALRDGLSKQFGTLIFTSSHSPDPDDARRMVTDAQHNRAASVTKFNDLAYVYAYVGSGGGYAIVLHDHAMTSTFCILVEKTGSRTVLVPQFLGTTT